MRVKVTFKAEKLPILYRHRFMALIKEALKESDKDYKDPLYPDKSSEYSKKVKPFTFNVSMLPGRTLKKEKFFIDNSVAGRRIDPKDPLIQPFFIKPIDGRKKK